MVSVLKKAAIWAVSLCIAGCGGGGGSGSTGTPRSGGVSAEPAMSLGATSVSVSADYGDMAPARSVRLTASNPPAAGLFLFGDFTGEALASIDFVAASRTQGDLTLQFRDPVDLPAGTTTESVRIMVCFDEQCTRQVQGSPATVAVNYTVTDSSTIALASASVAATGNLFDQSLSTAVASVSVTNPPERGLTFMLAAAATNVQSIANLSNATTQVELQFTFRPAAMAGIGVHSENVLVRACYDSACRREVPGSPLTVPTTYTVSSTVPPEAGVTPLPYLSRTALTHDVIDAEYSRALEAIVMVSASPRNALYLYDVATATERELPLGKAPTAVSVSPDGRLAAVGHDALVTHVDLDSLAAGAPVTKLLDVSATAFDVVLDGRGFVHVLPERDQWVSMHSIEVATNTETLGIGQLYARTRGRLQPSGDYVYTADTTLSPSDIAKFEVSSGAAVLLYDAPYHGDYPMCGDLWFKEDGATIYTKCGNTFRTSVLRDQDMIYSGSLQLSASQFGQYSILSLSQSDASDEIVLLEEDPYACGLYGGMANCYSHLAVYESNFLNRIVVYGLPPVEWGGSSTYAQRGAFVFHSSDGLHRYLISRLHAAPGATQPHFLTVVQ
jgi:hypothetical protein